MRKRADFRRKLYDVLAADSWASAAPKMLAFLFIGVAWKVLWVHEVRGQDTSDLFDTMLNGAVAIIPFILLSYASAIRQITLLKRLSLRSRKDDLTGLNNRKTFLENAEARLERYPNSVLMLMDADHFKAVNDTFGHAVGDSCISAIGHRLQWNLREEDVAGRLGGEEFALLLVGLKMPQAIIIAERIGLPVSFSSAGGAQDQTITLSIGAVETGGIETLDEMLAMCDDALYAAKDAGRARLAEWRDGDTHVLKRLARGNPFSQRERRKKSA
jgi:diguanylate cyclase (GGDEF)-like protein